MIEVCLGVAPVPQPSPNRNPGGDCFACALTAALRYLYPERAPTFDEVWPLFQGKYSNSDQVFTDNTWPGMRKALFAAIGALDVGLEITCDIVEPRFNNPEIFSYDWTFYGFDEGRYAHRLEGWLRGGWVALAVQSFAGAGPLDAELRHNVGDHFVVIDGIRAGWQPVSGTTGSRLEHEIHVVCSVRGAYWMPLRQYLIRHGSVAWWLVRRDER